MEPNVVQRDGLEITYYPEWTSKTDFDVTCTIDDSNGELHICNQPDPPFGSDEDAFLYAKALVTGDPYWKRYDELRTAVLRTRPSADPRLVSRVLADHPGVEPQFLAATIVAVMLDEERRAPEPATVSQDSADSDLMRVLGAVSGALGRVEKVEPNPPKLK